MVKKEVVAIIPARGGSKRIPHKNIVEFCGKPMIAWTIEAALQSGIFDKVFVSTDDQSIADVAGQYGVSVPFLREESHDDHAPVSAATISALQQIERKLGEKYAHVVQLMPNCPLRGADHIKNAYSHFVSAQADYQISCFRFGWMNPWWSVTLDDTLHPKWLFPEIAALRSQDQPPLYCPTGAVWIAETEKLLQAGSFYGDGHIFWPMDWKAAVDIDNIEDLEMARLFSEKSLYD